MGDAVGGYREFKLPDDWEVQIPDRLQQQGISRMEVLPKDCRLIQDLPFHHKNPFARILIAQALNGGFSVIGSDARFDDYGVKRVWYQGSSPGSIRRTLPSEDTLLAAQCLVKGHTLVTDNAKHFEFLRPLDLVVENPLA